MNGDGFNKGLQQLSMVYLNVRSIFSILLCLVETHPTRTSLRGKRFGILISHCVIIYAIWVIPQFKSHSRIETQRPQNKLAGGFVTTLKSNREEMESRLRIPTNIYKDLVCSAPKYLKTPIILLFTSLLLLPVFYLHQKPLIPMN